jgi:BRCA1-associated protein
MELESQRVWDYGGDNYVHRLIQNKADGKVMELDSGSIQHRMSVAVTDKTQEKLDALGLEFSSLLRSSLEAQRLFYEEKMSQSIRMIADLQSRLESMCSEQRSTADALSEQKSKWDELQESLENQKSEKQEVQQNECRLRDRIHALEKSIQEERALAEMLRANQKQWQVELQKKEEALAAKNVEMEDLKEQLRDVMMFLDARNKVEEALAKETTEEGRRAIIEGSVKIVPGSAARPSKLKAKKRTKK